MFKFLRPKSSATSTVSTDGRLLYAVGDVHGQLELLDRLLDSIAEDVASLGRSDRPVLIFVGDYIDRGPSSKGVCDRLIALKAASVQAGAFEVRTLMGNHEQTMLAFLDNPDAGAAWVEFGGAETLASYGVPRPPTRAGVEVWLETRMRLQRQLPMEHLAFLRGLELSASYGDYLFVHAGVRPGVPLEQQDPADIMWIRGDFLSQPHGLGRVVVHGHTPDEQPFIGRDRINIDTGAYATGVLTAVRLTGEAPTILQARKDRGN